MNCLSASFLIAIALLTLTGTAHAQIIYTDNFSGSGLLSAAANDPTVYADTAALGGSASANWAVNALTGSIRVLSNAANLVGVTSTQTAYLPFTPESGEIYVLTATLAPKSPASLSLGFSSGSGAGGGSKYDFVTVPASGTPTFNLGANSLNPVTSFGSSGDSGPETVTVTLNTMGANWIGTASLSSGPNSFASETFSVDPTISRIYFGSSNNPGPGNTISDVTSFELEAVPEPSTYAMMLGGLALLGFCVRRKLA